MIRVFGGFYDGGRRDLLYLLKCGVDDLGHELDAHFLRLRQVCIGIACTLWGLTSSEHFVGGLLRVVWSLVAIGGLRLNVVPLETRIKVVGLVVWLAGEGGWGVYWSPLVGVGGESTLVKGSWHV